MSACSRNARISFCHFPAGASLETWILISVDASARARLVPVQLVRAFRLPAPLAFRSFNEIRLNECVGVFAAYGSTNNLQKNLAESRWLIQISTPISRATRLFTRLGICSFACCACKDLLAPADVDPSFQGFSRSVDSFVFLVLA